MQAVTHMGTEEGLRRASPHLAAGGGVVGVGGCSPSDKWGFPRRLKPLFGA